MNASRVQLKVFGAVFAAIIIFGTIGFALIEQWLNYMRFLKDEYPYLFALAMRTNPFDREASPIVT